MENLDLTTATKEQIHQTIDYLVYQNYKHNRIRFPKWTVDQWAQVFGPDAYLMELEYQKNNQ
jgi:hypothetical protein